MKILIIILCKELIMLHNYINFHKKIKLIMLDDILFFHLHKIEGNLSNNEVKFQSLEL